MIQASYAVLRQLVLYRALYRYLKLKKMYNWHPLNENGLAQIERTEESTKHKRVKIWDAAWQNQQNDVRPAKTQISLGIRPVWSESSLCAWRKLGSLATHRAHNEDWLDWADAQADLSLCWAHSHLLVLSRGGLF